MSVVGFDFGNQHCYVAIARQGGIEIVTNDYSLRNTPSCVAFGPKTRIMGVAARQQLLTNLKNTVFNFKNLVGRNFGDPVVQSERSGLPYELVELPDHKTGIKVEHRGEIAVFTTEQILSMVLLKLKAIAEAYLKAKVVDCVISVPVHWTDHQRRSMLDAAQIVGLNVLRLLNETTAVALNYGIYKQDHPDENERPRTVVFVDIGESCSQISACAYNKGKLKMLGNVFDRNLGGRDFDYALREYFNQAFQKQFNLDARTSMRAWLRLADEAEKVKKQMSANSNQIPLNIECFLNDRDVHSSIKRADFEDLAKDLWKRLEELMRRLLSDLKLKTGDIDSVEMVGGSSRLPMVRQLIAKVFGKEPSTTLNQDEAVAKGCALQCAILSPAFRVREFNITDVQPYAIKLNWSADKGEEGEAEVFPENHPFPFSKMLTFYRREPFVLDASYSYPNHVPYPTTTIGRFRVQGVTPTADNESRKVKVKIRINPHGLFVVSSASMLEHAPGSRGGVEEPMETEDGPDAQADQPSKPQGSDGVQNGPAQTEAPADGAGLADDNQEKADAGATTQKEKAKEPAKPKVRSVDLPIDSQLCNMSAPEIAKLQKIEADLHKLDREEQDKVDAKNHLEEYVYEMRDRLNTVLSPYIAPKDLQAFQSMLERVEAWLYEEGDDQTREVYADKHNDLKKLGDPVIERYKEAEERPSAFHELGQVLQLSRKVCDAYHSKDPKYEHLDAADIEKVMKAIDERSQWYERQMNAQNKRSLTEPPVVFAHQIRQEKEAFERIVNPIINRPKPKVEPPPAEKAPEPTSNPADNAATGAESQEKSMEVD